MVYGEHTKPVGKTGHFITIVIMDRVSKKNRLIWFYTFLVGHVKVLLSLQTFLDENTINSQ